MNQRRMLGTCLQQLIFTLQFFLPLSPQLLGRDHFPAVPGGQASSPTFLTLREQFLQPDVLLSSRACLAGGTRWFEAPPGTGRFWDLFTSCSTLPQVLSKPQLPRSISRVIRGVLPLGVGNLRHRRLQSSQLICG